VELERRIRIDWPFIKSRRLSLDYPLEMYGKFVLPIGFCSAKYKNWLKNGQWLTVISNSALE